MIRNFRDTLDACSLQDIHCGGAHFTWVNRRSTTNLIFERLDRYVATFEWRLLYPVAHAQSLEFFNSDHRPILLDLGTSCQQLSRKKQMFRFEAHWTTEGDCKNIVEQGWRKGDTSLSLPERIQSCTSSLQEWAGRRFRDIPKQLKIKRSQLDRLQSHDQWQHHAKQIQDLERDVENLSTKEELYWKQRSRVNWLAHGDRNSKYFHACASIRRIKNHIRGLVSSHGDWCTDPPSMAEIVEHYFAGLFSTSNPTEADQRQILQCVEPKVDENLNTMLCQPFTADEIRKAVFDMHPDKAPGIDGMSVLFYQNYWETIGGEVTTAVLRVLNDGEPITDWNSTIITLIPKIKEPMTMKDFRPISLCTACYKIVSRTLTNRLRPILNHIVNDYQSAFIAGRIITDNIILGFEALHWIRSRKKGQKGYAALKLNMSKAYDRVEWNFLEGIMHRLGFSNIWTEKVMRCVRTVQYSFSLNGELIGKIHPSRGLRQGDPLSPYLFVLCAHGLSSALIEFEKRRIITGIRITPTCPSLTHLFFANDSLLFFQATVENCAGVQRCLHMYARASGQLINFEKSSISFSQNTNDRVKETIKTMLAIPVVHGHEVYLGLPVFSMRNKKMQFRYLVERVVKRIQGWGRKSFSIGGKETLIKAVIQSIPTYAMSCIRIPKSTCGEIEKECSNFWWGNDDGKKKMHWKTWKALCKPKCLGGLGFRHLKTFNKALLAKQIWRIIVNPESLVARVLKARYFKHQDIMKATLGSNPSYIWRSLMWSRPLLDKGMYWQVGNGERIDTFDARWIPRKGIPIHPPQYNGDYDKVQQLITDGKWNEQVVNNLFPDHVARDIYAIPLLPTNQEDCRYWIHDPKGKYTVREGYKAEIGLYDPPAYSTDHHLKSWWKFLWALSIPPKIRIFWWRVLHNIIPTSVNLASHHVPVSETCPLCQFGHDSTEHALFFCPNTKQYWKATQFWPLLKQVRFMEAFDIFIWMKEQQSKWELELFTTSTYAIWMERLKILHNHNCRHKVIKGQWSEALLQDFQNARSLLCKVPKRNHNYTAPTTWKAPPANHLRLDVDAAYNENSNSFAIGGVIRNHEGQPMIAYGQKIDKPPSVVYGELVAIGAGIRIAQEHNFQINHITSDSLLAVQAVTQPDEDYSYNGSLAADVKRLLGQYNISTLRHIRRTANNVAHSLAFFANSSLLFGSTEIFLCGL